jgi:hypothetical protein
LAKKTVATRAAATKSAVVETATNSIKALVSVPGTESVLPRDECNASVPLAMQPHRVPLFPADVLKRHNAFISTDTRFRAAARLLASYWREEQSIPIGVHVTDEPNPKQIELGSLLNDEAARAGRNFISTEVADLVRYALMLREEGALIDEDRLYGNALSSMPLCFNLLGPLALDLDLATKVFAAVLPGLVQTVQRIDFETSPGRRDARFLNDGTAFDAALKVITPGGEPATIFIEVKYSEGMTGPVARHRSRYDEVSREVRLYRNPDAMVLRSTALEQLWREHMMAQRAVDLGVVGKALFIGIGPRLNRRVQGAFKAYQAELANPEPKDDLDRVPFMNVTIETIIEVMAAAGAVSTARKLWDRYCDFGRVLFLAMSPPPPPPPSEANDNAPMAVAKSRRKAVGAVNTVAPSPAIRDDKAAA